MTFFCTACDKQLQLITNNEDEQSRIICDCGVINQIDCSDLVTKKLNVSLIKQKMKKILTQNLFDTVNDELKEDIILNSHKVKTHAETSLICFAILYLEYKNKLNFNSQYIVKKKQRKNIIKILVDMENGKIMKFIRTPLTYIDIYSHIYTIEEKNLYFNISDCLMFLNSCNKKNMEKIYEKIHEVIISLREEKSINNDIIEKENIEENIEDNKEIEKKSILKIKKNEEKQKNKKQKNKKNKSIQIKGYNIKGLIKFIAYSKLTIQDLIEFETILNKSNIYTI